MKTRPLEVEALLWQEIVGRGGVILHKPSTAADERRSGLVIKAAVFRANPRRRDLISFKRIKIASDAAYEIVVWRQEQGTYIELTPIYVDAARERRRPSSYLTAIEAEELGAILSDLAKKIYSQR